MEDRLKIIGGALAIIAACLGLVKALGYLWGGIISASTMIAVIILLKFIAKKGKKSDQSHTAQSIGEGAEAQESAKFEDIEQTSHARNGNVEQSVGKGAKAGKGMSFKNIKQN